MSELAKETQFGVLAAPEISWLLWGEGRGGHRTIVVVALVGPGLSVAAVQEHLHASPHQVLPARPHGGVEGALLLDLNQLACEPRETHVLKVHHTILRDK